MEGIGARYKYVAINLYIRWQMRYFIHLGFDGTNYRGWQRQKGQGNTVQEVIEQTLHKIFKKNITVYGCGRTDAGVHASQYIIHIDLDDIPHFDLTFRLNKNLPHSISIYEIIEVSDEQHCRYHAVSRTYDYFIHFAKDPFLHRYSALYEDLNLDYELMRKTAALILGTQDFKPLCKQPDLHNHTICEITHCALIVNETQGRIRFTITGNRFLKGMVRLCVFFLLEVGRGNMSLEEFKDVLNQTTILKTKRLVHPHGLFLSQVNYPFLTLSNSHHVMRMLRHGLE